MIRSGGHPQRMLCSTSPMDAHSMPMPCKMEQRACIAHKHIRWSVARCQVASKPHSRPPNTSTGVNPYRHSMLTQQQAHKITYILWHRRAYGIAMSEKKASPCEIWNNFHNGNLDQVDSLTSSTAILMQADTGFDLMAMACRNPTRKQMYHQSTAVLLIEQSKYSRGKEIGPHLQYELSTCKAVLPTEYY